VSLNDEKIKKQDRDWVVVSVFLLSPRILGEMIPFDYNILFKRVETTNYESLDACCILGGFIWG